MKRQRPKRGDYITPVLELAALVRPGEFAHIHVQHDSWCALLAKRGPCSCVPDVTLVRGEDSAA